MIKSKKEKAFSLIGFILLFILLTLLLSAAVKPDSPMDCTDKRKFEALRVFDEPNNTLDALFFGHSGVFCGINPMEMYAKYGFTSYDCSFASQMPWETTEFLRETLKRQKPKVVVVDVDQLLFKNINHRADYVWSQIRRAAPIIDNHTAWKKFLPGGEQRERNFNKGYRRSRRVSPYDSDDSDGSVGGKNKNNGDKQYKIAAMSLRCFDEVIEICKEYGVELLFVELPSKKRWNNSTYNAVKKYVDKKGVRFIDLNKHEKEFDFDWKKDTSDGGEHLNESGALKTSLWLGRILQEDYKLPDRREDKAYEFWKEDYAKYLADKAK